MSSVVGGPAVQPLVGLQATELSEAAAAERAAEGSLSRVDALVPREIAKVQELLPAVGARVARLPRMALQMCV